MPTHLTCPWDAYAPATISFCEARLCAWIAEPSNTWSNLAFVIAGIYLLVGRRAQSRDNARLLRLVGGAAVLIGLGSFAFHATGRFFAEVADLTSMYLFSALLVVFNLRRLARWSGAALAAGYVGLVVGPVLLMLATHTNGIVVFALQLALGLGLEVVLYRRQGDAVIYRHFKWMMGCFAAAFAIWITDKTGLLCDPDNHWVTGHAIWHVGNALCLVFFFDFQRQFFGQHLDDSSR